MKPRIKLRETSHPTMRQPTSEGEHTNKTASTTPTPTPTPGPYSSSLACCYRSSSQLLPQAWHNTLRISSGASFLPKVSALRVPTAAPPEQHQHQRQQHQWTESKARERAPMSTSGGGGEIATGLVNARVRIFQVVEQVRSLRYGTRSALNEVQHEEKDYRRK